MKILVPIKRVADPNNANKMKVSPDGKRVVSGDLPWAINPFDEYALEAGLRLLENGATGERFGELVIVTLGPDDVQTTMRQALAMGADRGIHIPIDEEKLDAMIVAQALAAVVRLEAPDLVLMGKQAVDGDSNNVGQMLAEFLGWPMATFAMSIALEGKQIVVGREVDTGVLTLRIELPAVVTVDLRIVLSKSVRNGKTPESHAYPDDVRHISVKGIMAAKKKPIATKTLEELGVQPNLSVRYLRFEVPPARSGSTRYVESVSELVRLLHTEAKVI